MTLRFDACFLGIHLVCNLLILLPQFVSASCYRREAARGDTRSEASGDPSVFNKALNGR